MLSGEEFLWGPRADSRPFRLPHHLHLGGSSPKVDTMNAIFELESLDDLQSYFRDQSAAEIRPRLVEEFFAICEYKNAAEWNHAVRLCEALAIVGWGDLEPVQAVRGTFFNGNPESTFYNRYSEPRFVSAIWSRRKQGWTLEAGRTAYHASPDVPDRPSMSDDYPVVECVQDVKLATQRNWISKSPVLITRTIGNCYATSEPLVEDVEERLSPRIDRELDPEDYGKAIDRVALVCHLSYEIPGSLGCNYVTYDDNTKLNSQKQHARLLEMFSAQEIDDNSYYLRRRIDYGAFLAAKGQMTVDLHFTRKFSEQTAGQQKQVFAAHLSEAIDGVVERLKRKKLAYQLDEMARDFKRIVEDWARENT